MKVASHGMPYVVKPGRRRLADAVGVVAVPAAERHSRHQRGTDEPLAIDDIVVAAFAYGAPETRHLPPRRQAKRLFPPAAGRGRNKLPDTRGKPPQRRERLFPPPGKPRGRPMAPGLGQRWHVMDHIAKRRRLDEQDIG